MNLLDETPENWIKASVGRFCDVQLGKMLQNDSSSEKDKLKPYLKAINVGKDGLDLSHEFSMWIRPQEADRFRLTKGDILVSEGGDAGRTVVFDADGEFYFQNAINRVRPNHLGKIEPKFIYYWFTFLKITGYVEMVCNVATIPHFTAEKVKAAPIALPPIDTQRRTVRYLDEKTAQIAGLIEIKLELLDRLAEERKALITRAVVTGSLSQDSSMMSSDIEVRVENRSVAEGIRRMNLLDETPENWIKASVGRFCDVQLGKMLQNDSSSEKDKLKPYLKAINVGKDGLDLSHEFSMWIRPQEADRFRLTKGDILVSEGGDAGRTVVFDADGEFYFQNAINRVRPNHLGKIEPKFIYYWFTFLKITGYVEMVCNVATIPHFTAEKVKAAPIALPPIDTQRRTVRYLDGKMTQIDVLVKRIEDSVMRLEEYRSALVTDAVTGKISGLQ